MKRIMLKILLRYFSNEKYVKMKKDKIDDLLDHIANDPASKELTDYLNQLADGYKNQFLYTQDIHYKGMIAAYVTLREELEKRRDKPKEKVEVVRVNRSVKY